MKHLIGSLAVGVNENFKNMYFLSNLETIDTYYQIQFKITDHLTEIELPSLTTINGPSWEIALHDRLKRIHFPNLKNITHVSGNIEKFDIFFLGQLPEFCVSSDTIYNFMRSQGLKTNHVYGNICPPNFDNSKICQNPTAGCVQIFGDVNVGPIFDMKRLNSVEIIFGTLTINGARLEDANLLVNLKYIAVLKR
ncbi:hypothetical protein L3Y34_006996 [Caenorhabditis briggsae]|uniref:Receptor L-domain domain-containing protein n=1 Tax=Caenorhabditis briggsae TaxID=6238 RepID=A0AAE9D091_CAEBR|nr:hypothetical protein L3Y34_006996 [Caenorhabditis briggsae]